MGDRGRRERLVSLAMHWGPFLIGSFLLLVVAPLVLSDFRLNLLGKFLTYAIVAIGLDLLWGYAGLLSLGQGLFFGLGAYCMAMYLKLEASGDQLPDFMVWSGNLTGELPLFWQPFRSPVFALAMAILLPTVVASVLGYFVFRSRVQGVYFSLITQALTLLVGILIVGQQPVTGGTNGITNLPTIFGHVREDPDTLRALYLITAFCLGAVFLGARWLVGSRFGRLLVALRDDENRVRFSGYDPVAIKVLVLAVSAALAGLAGALFVPQVGIISPAALGIVPSVEMVIWVAVGGRGALVGAVLGALLVNTAKSSFSESYPEHWQYFLGALFIVAVLLFPGGLIGGLADARRGIARLLGRMRRASAMPMSNQPVVAPAATERLDPSRADG